MSFANLSKFVLDFISLPHSNADSERVFSQVNLIKTKSPNKMGVSTVNAVVLAKQRLKSKGDCSTYEPTQTEFSRMTESMMYKKKTESDPDNIAADQTIGELYSGADVVEYNSILMPGDL